MAYPTLSDVKTYLGVTTTTDDARLTLFVNWTEALIHAYLGRDLNSAEYTQLFYKPVTEALQLDNFPVASLTSITTDDILQTLTDFDLVIDIGTVYGDFITGNTVSIVYTGGYTTLPLPVVDTLYAIIEDRYLEYKGESDAEVKDVTLFDFAKVSYDTSASSGNSLTYTGVGSSGNVPQHLQDYLGVLDMYKSNNVLLNGDGVG